ncbi:MAG: Uma2 family endonuclease [Chloroherpetonaceae bacterium]|nr:Uma2 family endonuclease [Chloroherpetonaceae bacterium]MDW8019353.1 Uma2 family endonuclease [Chloroherpetonaceae bacterium]MDW8465448.1 Uma2 family endonuclease [Chloroherpetonaceae bacterium]
MEAVIEVAPSEYELERGKPVPSRNHGKIQARLSQVLLNRYGTQYDIVSEVTLALPEKDATPDLAIYPKRPDDWQHDEVKVTEAPLLVMEILSPAQRLSELEERVQQYHRAGVQVVWVIFPSLRMIAIYSAKERPIVVASGEVKDEQTGVHITIEELFGA